MKSTAVVALLLLGVACGGSGGRSAGGSSDAWMGLRIVDVDGKAFTIEDLRGKPVLVENFAMWCSNCLRQLGDTQKAAAEAGDSAHFVALSVEVGNDAATVAVSAEGRAAGMETGFESPREIAAKLDDQR